MKQKLSLFEGDEEKISLIISILNLGDDLFEPEFGNVLMELPIEALKEFKEIVEATLNEK